MRQSDEESLSATSQICFDFYTFVLVTNGIYIIIFFFFFDLLFCIFSIFLFV